MGAASRTATLLTREAGGPARSHATISSTASASPSTCAEHAAVRLVAHPSGHPELLGRVLRLPPERHPLDAPGDPDLDGGARSGSEDAAGRVRRGVGVGGDDLLDATDDRLATWATAAPVNSIGSATRRGEVGAGQPEAVVGGEPVEQVVGGRTLSRISSATATACSLMASWAVSRPTPRRTAAISTLVVARNGR